MKKTFLSLFLLIFFIPGVNAQTVLIGGNDIDVVTSGDGIGGCNVWAATANMVGTPSEVSYTNPFFPTVSFKGTVLKDASLNTYLNNDYYNSLTDEAKKVIVSHNFNIGPVTLTSSLASMPNYDEFNLTLEEIIKEESSYKWKGKVALMNLSDYISTNSNQKECSTLQDFTSDKYEECLKTEWLSYLENDRRNYMIWMLNPAMFNADNGTVHVFVYGSNGRVSSLYAYRSFSAAQPVVYLNSNITLGGCGSKDDPYIIGGDKKCNAGTENTGNVIDNESNENTGPQIVEVPSTSAYASIIIAVLGIICVIVSVFVMRRVTKKTN